MDTWTLRDGFLERSDLYPDKTSNLMGKELVVATFHYPPANVILENVQPPVYDGLEMRMIYEFTKLFNFTWRVICKQDEWWGKIWGNGSGIGPMGHVSMGAADAGLNLQYLWEYEHNYLDFR